jgi:hypothetical protein
LRKNSLNHLFNESEEMSRETRALKGVSYTDLCLNYITYLKSCKKYGKLSIDIVDNKIKNDDEKVIWTSLPSRNAS